MLEKGVILSNLRAHSSNLPQTFCIVIQRPIPFYKLSDTPIRYVRAEIWSTWQGQCEIGGRWGLQDFEMDCIHRSPGEQIPPPYIYPLFVPPRRCLLILRPCPSPSSRLIVIEKPHDALLLARQTRHRTLPVLSDVRGKTPVAENEPGRGAQGRVHPRPAAGGTRPRVGWNSAAPGRG